MLIRQRIRDCQQRTIGRRRHVLGKGQAFAHFVQQLETELSVALDKAVDAQVSAVKIDDREVVTVELALAATDDKGNEPAVFDLAKH